MSCDNPTCLDEDDCDRLVAEFNSTSPEMAQRAVLGLLLSHHPELFTITELVLAVNIHRSSDRFSLMNVKEAVEELVAAGLVNCEGTLVIPSRAARCARQLDEP
jgi:hypothetical protein